MSCFCRGANRPPCVAPTFIFWATRYEIPGDRWWRGGFFRGSPIFARLVSRAPALETLQQFVEKPAPCRIPGAVLFGPFSWAEKTKAKERSARNGVPARVVALEYVTQARNSAAQFSRGSICTANRPPCRTAPFFLVPLGRTRKRTKAKAKEEVSVSARNVFQQGLSAIEYVTRCNP